MAANSEHEDALEELNLFRARRELRLEKRKARQTPQVKVAGTQTAEEDVQSLAPSSSSSSRDLFEYLKKSADKPAPAVVDTDVQSSIFVRDWASLSAISEKTELKTVSATQPSPRQPCNDTASTVASDRPSRADRQSSKPRSLSPTKKDHLSSAVLSKIKLFEPAADLQSRSRQATAGSTAVIRTSLLPVPLDTPPPTLSTNRHTKATTSDLVKLFDVHTPLIASPPPNRIQTWLKASDGIARPPESTTSSQGHAKSTLSIVSSVSAPELGAAVDAADKDESKRIFYLHHTDTASTWIPVTLELTSDALRIASPFNPDLVTLDLRSCLSASSIRSRPSRDEEVVTFPEFPDSVSSGSRSAIIQLTYFDRLEHIAFGSTVVRVQWLTRLFDVLGKVQEQSIATAELEELQKPSLHEQARAILDRALPKAHLRQSHESLLSHSLPPAGSSRKSISRSTKKALSLEPVVVSHDTTGAHLCLPEDLSRNDTLSTRKSLGLAAFPAAEATSSASTSSEKPLPQPQLDDFSSQFTTRSPEQPQVDNAPSPTPSSIRRYSLHDAPVPHIDPAPTKETKAVGRDRAESALEFEVVTDDVKGDLKRLKTFIQSQSGSDLVRSGTLQQHLSEMQHQLIRISKKLRSTDNDSQSSKSDQPSLTGKVDHMMALINLLLESQHKVSAVVEKKLRNEGLDVPLGNNNVDGDGALLRSAGLEKVESQLAALLAKIEQLSSSNSLSNHPPAADKALPSPPLQMDDGVFLPPSRRATYFEGVSDTSEVAPSEAGPRHRPDKQWTRAPVPQMAPSILDPTPQEEPGVPTMNTEQPPINNSRWSADTSTALAAEKPPLIKSKQQSSASIKSDVTEKPIPPVPILPPRIENLLDTLVESSSSVMNHQADISSYIQKLNEFLQEDRVKRSDEWKTLTDGIARLEDKIAAISVPQPHVHFATPPPHQDGTDLPIDLQEVIAGGNDSQDLQADAADPPVESAHTNGPRPRKLSILGLGGPRKPRSGSKRSLTGGSKYRLWGAPTPNEANRARWVSEHTLMGAAQAQVRENQEAVKDTEAIPTGTEAAPLEGEGEGELPIEPNPNQLAEVLLNIQSVLQDIQSKTELQRERSIKIRQREDEARARELAEIDAKKAEIAAWEAEKDALRLSDDAKQSLELIINMLKEKNDASEAALLKMDEMKSAIPSADAQQEHVNAVKAQMVAEVKDFRAAMISETRKMLDDVGRLKEQKKALQQDLADMLAFKSRHGGGAPEMRTIKTPTPTPAPQQDTADDGASQSGGLAGNRLFGPRKPK